MTARERRYGIFFAPPVSLVDSACRGMVMAERLHGFRAAGAYPPHITLIGSVAAVSEEALVEHADRAVDGLKPMKAWCKGLQLSASSDLGYRFVDGPDASQHSGVTELYRHIVETTAPARRFVESDRTAASRWAAEQAGRISPHLSIVSHDGPERPDEVNRLRDEMCAADLDLIAEVEFDTVMMYRFESDNWSGEYWHSMTWAPIGHWSLREQN